MQQRQRMIGVSLGVHSTDAALAALAQVAAEADIAELRLDFMEEYNLPRLLSDRPCPIIVTNRPQREGGRFSGSEADRLRPLRQAIDLGADYVDIEHDAVSLLTDRGDTALIVSFHDFRCTPPDLTRIAADLHDRGADIVKVVGTARDAADNRYVFDVLGQAQVPTIAICMGAAGLPSRVLALRYDRCFLTYATLGSGERVAPGQLPIAAMRDVYLAEAIGPRTTAIGLVSDTLPPEAEVAQLNQALRQPGPDAVAVPFILPPTADVTALLRACSDPAYGLTAWIVAPPHQESPARSGALDELDDAARQCGAVNLVVREADGLAGTWAADPVAALIEQHLAG